jgi:type I restriction enzyme, S subunit
VSFRAYRAYRDSGVEWLGAIPASWSVAVLKRDLQFLTSGSRGWAAHYSDDGAIFIRIGNLTRDRLEVDLSDVQRVAVPPGAEGERTRVIAGDLLFSITAFMGSVAVAPEGINSAYVSQHVALARLRGKLLLPRWVGYATLSASGKAHLDAQSYGGAKIQLSLEDVAALPLAVPPLDEQAAIIEFLDRETRKIDALVAEQERLMALLKEKRQAAISQAVTKGLDPKANLKDSGVEWLGEVPEKWTVLSLSKIALEKCDGPFGSGLKSEHYTDDGIRVIRLQNIRNGSFDGTDAAYIDRNYYETSLSGHDVCAGDLLIAGLGDERNTVGRACVAPATIEPAMVKADCFRLRLDGKLALAGFVARQLTAGSAYDAGILSSGSTRSRIPLSVMITRKIALPPFEEQSAIVAFTQERETQIDMLVAEANRGIALLKERRAALISDAVTGKIDVRGLARPAQAAA